MPTPGPRKYTVLNPDEWRVIIEAYKIGTMTIRELSETYSVSPRAIQNKVKEAGATRSGSFMPVTAPPAATAAMSVASHTAIPKPSSKPLANAERQKITEDRIAATIESAIVSALSIEHANARCVAILNAPASTPEELSHASATLRALERAVMIVDRTDRLKRRALQMDAGNASISLVLPELPIRDMTPEEYRALRHKQAQEDNGVVFDDEGNPIVEKAISDDPADDDRHAEGCDDDPADE